MTKSTPKARPTKRSNRRPFKSESGNRSEQRDSVRSTHSNKRGKPSGGRSQTSERIPTSKPGQRVKGGSEVKPNHSVDQKRDKIGQVAETNNHKAGQASSSSANNKAYFVIVDSEHDGQRVDNFLVTHLKGVPKTHIYRIIRKGEVRVNKGRVKPVTRLKEGDSIRLPPIRLSDASNEQVDGARYEFLNKTILFEDDALLVINKPTGMAVHAGSGIKVGVIEALRALRTDIKYLELVHRLDRETSGCLVLAKKSSALKQLHEDFKTNSLKNKRLDKRYVALVKGQWKHGERRITKALNTDARKHGERFVVVDESGRYASSIFCPQAVSSVASLVDVTLLTGRTHQVRVHAQSEGHPLAGDSRYGDHEFNKQMKSFRLSRLFLHAASLSFTHPMTQVNLTVTAPLPDDLTNVLDALNLCTNS